MTSEFRSGDSVWIPDENDAWLRAKVEEVQGKNINVRTANGGEARSVESALCEICASTPEDECKIEDLTKLPDLHHPALLATLHERFKRNEIYTYTGPILLAINPFKRINGIYDENIMNKYISAGVQAQTLAPHAYALADNAFNSMIEAKGRNQSILVSGESGAGKTETTKIVMSYLTTVSYKNEGKKGSIKTHKVAQRVLQANPLLEAFGNAKTIRNDNSSRFGKLIQMQFDKKKNILCGAAIDTYLLEKARVVHQAGRERNYHVFYELVKGASAEERKKYSLPKLEECHYTNQSGIYSRVDVDDESQFEATKKAMEILDFNDTEVESCFRIVAAILHLGNVQFEHKEFSDEDGCVLSDSSLNACETSCKLLNLDHTLLESALCERKIELGRSVRLAKLGIGTGDSESYVKRHTVSQAEEARDALATTLYKRLFGWIVWKVNDSIGKTSDGRPNSVGRARKSIPQQLVADDRNYYYDYTIGCLDVFGFEVFEVNSFEQLCINYCNETLQQQFNTFVFELEQAIYVAEGIDWTKVSFPDNQKCLEMIEARPIGLLSLIDEECLYPNGSDKSLASKLYSQLPKKFTKFIASRKDQIEQRFVIKHFAGDVVYKVDNFCKKNKNELKQDAVNLIRSSKDKFISKLLPSDAAGASGDSDCAEYFAKLAEMEAAKMNKTTSNRYRSSFERRRSLLDDTTTKKLQQTTVGSHFKQQLAVAMMHIKASQPHYIRCLKPNDQNVSDKLDRVRVVEQLRYSGVLEVIKVARMGYPTRFRMAAFVDRFNVLSFAGSIEANKKNNKRPDRNDMKAMSLRIIENSGLVLYDEYQLGHTKVFLRAEAFKKLELLKIKKVEVYAIRLQTNYRRWVAERRYQAGKRGTVRMQSLYRSYKVRCEYYDMVQLVQKERNESKKRRKKKEEKAGKVIQKAMRQNHMNVKLKELVGEASRQRAAIVLQKVARRVKAQKEFDNALGEKVSGGAAVIIQGLARIIAAKRLKEDLELEKGAAESDNYLSAAVLVVIVFVVLNPTVIFMLCVGAVGAAFGAGMMMELQSNAKECGYDGCDNNSIPGERYCKKHKRRSDSSGTRTVTKTRSKIKKSPGIKSARSRSKLR